MSKYWRYTSPERKKQMKIDYLVKAFNKQAKEDKMKKCNGYNPNELQAETIFGAIVTAFVFFPCAYLWVLFILKALEYISVHVKIV